MPSSALGPADHLVRNTLQRGRHPIQIGGSDRHHRTQLLGKELRQKLVIRERQIQSAATGERHFQQCHQCAAIGAVVIRKEQTFPAETLHGFEEADHEGGIIEVRRFRTQLTEYLGQAAGAETVSARPEIDQDQPGIGLGTDLRRQGAAHIGHRRKCRYDQSQRRDHFPIRPLRPHGEAVLAHGNGDSERRTELHAHRSNGLVERLFLGVLPGGRHPVGGQHHAAQIGQLSRRQIGQGFAYRHPGGGGRVEGSHG